MTQCDRIIKHIEEYGSITDDDAKNLRPSIHRLASRIHELRKRGEKIKSETIYGQNEYGKWHCTKYTKGE